MLGPKYKAISASKSTVKFKTSAGDNNPQAKYSQQSSMVRCPSSLGRKNNLTSRMARMYENNKVIEFQEARKESYLNACYNKRKDALLQITKQNKKIYERINSQKSNYSSRNLNKSYDSICSNSSRVSRRSSKSNGSRYSNSGVRSASKTIAHKVTKLSMPPKPVLKIRNVNSLNDQDILTLNRMFCRDEKTKAEHAKAENPRARLINNENTIEEIVQFPRGVKLGKLGKSILTPERPGKHMDKGSSMPISLPQLKQKTPNRLTKLETIMQDFGYRRKF